MERLTVMACLLLLALLLGGACYQVLTAVFGTDLRRIRPRVQSLPNIGSWTKEAHLFRHLSDQLQSSQTKLKPSGFIWISIVSGTMGVLIGTLYFSSWQGMV